MMAMMVSAAILLWIAWSSVWYGTFGDVDMRIVVAFLKGYWRSTLFGVCLIVAAGGGLYGLGQWEAETCHRECSPYASRTVGDTCECQNKSKHWVPQGPPRR